MRRRVRALAHHSGLENEWRRNVRSSRKITGINKAKLPEEYGCRSGNRYAGE
jgi:hypothetical protein